MPDKITRADIGSARYQESLRREADYWERVSRGQVDSSVTTSSRPELKAVVTGDTVGRMLDTAAAGRRVLDLGCGGGWHTLELARRGCLVDGVDVCVGRIRDGMRAAEQFRGSAERAGAAQFFVGDLNRLGIASNVYDAILAASVLHHVLDLEALLDQAFRALKPGGTLVCLDHMESSLAGRVIRYGLLVLLPTEVPYRRKLAHGFNRIMARVYRRTRPGAVAPARFTLPESSPFEDVSGSQAVEEIRRRFTVEVYQTHLAFADVVAGHLRTGSPERDVRLARQLRRLDDWLVRHARLRGDFYFLIARKADGGTFRVNPGTNEVTRVEQRQL